MGGGLGAANPGTGSTIQIPSSPVIRPRGARRPEPFWRGIRLAAEFILTPVLVPQKSASAATPSPTIVPSAVKERERRNQE